jgi:putative membrane protein
MIIKLLVTFAAYLAMLYILNRSLDGFEVKPGGLVAVAIILLPVSFLLGWILKILALPFNIVTLGLLTFIFTWLINTAIMKATDYFSDQMTIHRTSSLFISGAALSLCQWLIKAVL